MGSRCMVIYLVFLINFVQVSTISVFIYVYCSVKKSRMHVALSHYTICNTGRGKLAH